MVAKAKMSPIQWGIVRNHWESDSRKGYVWLIEELRLPVSATAIRKVAVRDGWMKQEGRNDEEILAALHEKVAKPARKTAGKVRRNSKVSQRNHGKVSRGASETLNNGKTLTVNTRDAVEKDPDKFGTLKELCDAEEIFVREYMADWNGAKAAIKAGYSATSAWKLLKKPQIREAIELLASARARRLGIDADELIRMWSAIATFDANEISQLRRVCCPYCHGKNHEKQYTPAGLEEARKRHEKERQRRLRQNADDDIGEFPEYKDVWYDKRLPPVEDCPECRGDGVAEVFFADTRTLSPVARLVYAGVKDGRDGIEIISMSKEKAADNLARALGLFRERETKVSINMVSSDELFRIYEEKMRNARERQAMVMAERGMVNDSEL